MFVGNVKISWLRIMYSRILHISQIHTITELDAGSVACTSHLKMIKQRRRSMISLLHTHIFNI